MVSVPSVGGQAQAASAPNRNTKNASDQQGIKSEAVANENINWDSEKQIVASLWKLQELEAKVSHFGIRDC
jgi:hypothetical protein